MGDCSDYGAYCFQIGGLTSIDDGGQGLAVASMRIESGRKPQLMTPSLGSRRPITADGAFSSQSCVDWVLFRRVVATMFNLRGLAGISSSLHLTVLEQDGRRRPVVINRCQA